MISIVLDLVKEGFSHWRETRKEKHQVKLSVLKNKQRLAENQQSHNHDWEMASLENADQILRIVSFSMFALPLIVTVMKPDIGAQIFANLDKAPDWYVRTFISINGGVWGIVELKHAAPQFINAVKKVFSRDP